MPPSSSGACACSEAPPRTNSQPPPGICYGVHYTDGNTEAQTAGVIRITQIMGAGARTQRQAVGSYSLTLLVGSVCFTSAPLPWRQRKQEGESRGGDRFVLRRDAPSPRGLWSLSSAVASRLHPPALHITGNSSLRAAMETLHPDGPASLDLLRTVLSARTLLLMVTVMML